MFSSATPYKNQRYSVLKQECKEAKKLFEDPEFPATHTSLFYRKPPPGTVEWKRPREICDDPHLFVEGISSHDLNQGVVGNCWFVAACSCLALKPTLWQKVIPDWKEQEWDPKHPENYAGIFHFQFWIFGEWVDVVVDDRLPTVNGELIYCHSKTNNEFWSALLEKAYAKLSACYESLDGGNTGDAVVDFSGAVSESIDLEAGKYASDLPAQIKLFEDLLKVYERGGIISCSIKASPSEIEAHMTCGLVKGHAYSVTAVRKARLGHGLMAFFKAEKIFLIRMRNPWGKTEWNGAWSDHSEEWEKVGSMERQAMDITVEDDGEFWMPFDDWCKYFTDVDVCRIINTSLLSLDKTWHEAVYFGSWTKHAEPLYNRCGGCANHRQTFLQNPQYLFDVTKEEDEVLISLQQRDMKIHRPMGQGENLTMGFAILKVEQNRKYRLHDIVTQQNVATSTYINARTVFMRKVLPKGRYIIIPTTFMPEVLGDFMIRVYTDVDSGCRELTLDKPRVRCWSGFLGYPQAMTQIYVHRAEGLEKQDSTGGADPYVIICCEGHTVKSTVQKDTLEPLFDTRAIFYRKKPRKPITVQVWNSNAVQDQFMGQVVLAASLKDSSDPQILQLRKRGQEMADEMPGTISLRVVTTSQLTDM
ncbi:calpain-5-like [Megalops cyprinoides]|uniref:calpain-5-like n=1 Tax=Megalops cyprinoides TaxID=118141 RepID=UPI001865297E|nr:calpain-5-like [Megalops cyprinoides]XP_036380168.1 calpain-5-like [Megalops cyprinoides]